MEIEKREELFEVGEVMVFTKFLDAQYCVQCQCGMIQRTNYDIYPHNQCVNCGYTLKDYSEWVPDEKLKEQRRCEWRDG